MIVFASVFVYTPLHVAVSPQKPSIELFPSSFASDSIGSNRTSATSNVTATRGSQELLYNGDFYSSPDGWYCFHIYTSQSKLNCYWSSSDTGSSGGVVYITGSVNTNSNDDAEVGQYVYIPSGGVSSATITVRYKLANAPLLSNNYLLVYLYDTVSNSFVLQDSTSITSVNAYLTYSTNVNPSNLVPGRKYLILVGIYTSNSFLSSGNVDFYIDAVSFTVSTNQYTFSNDILEINNTDTKSFYSKLVLVNFTTNDTSISLNLTLKNQNGVESTPIEIDSGSVVSSETSTIEIPTPYSGYFSGKINLKVVSQNPVSARLQLYLVSMSTNGGGSVTYYPIVININSG